MADSLNRHGFNQFEQEAMRLYIIAAKNGSVDALYRYYYLFLLSLLLLLLKVLDGCMILVMESKKMILCICLV